MDNYLTPTTVDDIVYVAPRLREADRQECLAATGREPLGVLLDGLKISDITLTLRSPDGERMGLMGVSPSYLEGAGAIWLCATTDIYKHQIAFLRRSKEFLPLLQKRYLVLHNCVDARNEVHIKWLKWMGFTFIHKHEHFGAAGLPFYEFVRI